MKRVVLFVMGVILIAGVLTSCTKKNVTKTEEITDLMLVGMVTDAGTIDDKSFNQGTWEGIKKAASEGLVSEKYLKPVGTTEADYIKEISNLYDAGYKFIVTPGFKFETSIYKSQERYPDAKFVLIDGFPHAGDWNAVVGPNTVSIFFAEDESGFLAGVATALQLGEGLAGFIGGMEIPAVQMFNWGFQRGLAYANNNFGTNVTIERDNVVYQGSFDNVAAGQQLAAGMFDKGVDVIFCAAGGVGIGAINEAKARAASGEEVWIVGVDADQYAEGKYEGDESVILTSAMKYIDVASYDMIKAELNDEFPGGQTLRLNATNGGIGIPVDNPNLDADVEARVAEVFGQLADGTIIVSAEQAEIK